MAEKLIRVGALKGPHGLKGMVKAKIGLDDYDLLMEAGPLVTDKGQELTVTRWNPVGQNMLALAIEGIDTVEKAEALRGVQVNLNRDSFPDEDDEVYLDELEGMNVLGPDGATIGTVTGWQELPAGPALNVKMGDIVKVLPLEEEFVTLGDAVELTELGVQILSL